MSNNDDSLKNIHNGHRERMWNKFRVNGLDAFTEHEILETLLFLLIPRVNTNETAHRLLLRFKSLNRVLSADPLLLKEIDGIGETSALRLHFIGKLHRYLSKEKPVRFRLTSSADMIEYCENYFRNFKSECLTYFLLDKDYNVIFYDDILSGSEFGVEISIKKIMRQCILYECPSLLLAHNHLHGSSNASNVDIISTKRMAALLRSIDIEMIDHIIVKDGVAISMRENGLIAGLWG